MKTRAAVAVTSGRDLVIEEVELDDPRGDELRVKLVTTGVCHTDAIVRDQWYPVPQPVVLGHEGAGIVEAVGAGVVGFAPGDRVVLGPNSCGDCANCRAGHPMYCATLFERNFGARRADGSTAFSNERGPIGSHFFGQSSFAAQTNVQANGAVKVGADAPLEILGPLGCGIMTGAGAVLNVLAPSSGSTIAIFGTGAVGMAAMLAARATGVTTTVMVDILEPRLEFAREMGADHVVDATRGDPADAIRQIIPGGAQFALETTGRPEVFEAMTRALAPMGQAAVVGAAPFGTEASMDIGSLLVSGIGIRFVVEGDAVPREFIPRLIRLHAAGRFPFDRLIKTYDFDQINQAFADSASGTTLKPVLRY